MTKFQPPLANCYKGMKNNAHVTTIRSIYDDNICSDFPFTYDIKVLINLNLKAHMYMLAN